MDRRPFVKPELLAPAGDLARAKTAILYGADAVYLGGQRFSLRSRASNFTLAEIAEACAFARSHGASIHVTVNLIPHEEDMEGLEEYLQQLESAGVRAIIAASPTVMVTARRAAPLLAVHCSTQMSVTNAEAAEYLRETLGISRVVLARECTLEDIRQITSDTVETEAFIHGGMCVNYSGRCTLSNRMTLRDANRGGCAQSCRWLYHLYEDEREVSRPAQLFTMGSRDLCAADEIWPLMQAGVTSLKIEGRMKTEYYIASTVSGYRHLIDELAEAGRPLDQERMAFHRREILKGENRETWGGFFHDPEGKNSLIRADVTGRDVSHDFLGTVASYSSGTAVIVTRNPFAPGDLIEVLSPFCQNRQFRPDWLRNEEGAYMDKSRQPMASITMPVPFAVHPGDILRRCEDAD